MWSRIVEALGRGYANRPGARAVRSALESAYPDLEATDVWLRKRESGRDVVAVLYRRRDATRMSVGMPPYKLYAIHADLSTEELAGGPSSPYALRGIK